MFKFPESWNLRAKKSFGPALLRLQGGYERARAFIGNASDRLSGSDVKYEEASFYPGVEAVIRAPMPVSSQWLILSTFALFLVALLWACFSEIDIVSPAQGKAIPSSRTQLIQAPQLSRVRQILVREGDAVSKGQPLIELHDTQARSEWRQASGSAEQLTAQKRRLEALLAAVASKSESPVYPGEESSWTLADRLERASMQNQWATYRAELASLEKKAEQQTAAVGRIEAEIKRLENLIPFSRRTVERYEKLGQQVSQETLDQAREELADRQSTLEARRHELRQAKAERDQAMQDVAVHQERFVSQLSLELARTETELGGAQEAALRSENTLDQYTLTSPIDGIVMDIVADTRAVVEPAETLMRIVPRDVPLEVEVKILNRDIGFVHKGQRVNVKVDTFNFTKYGVIPGTIVHVAQDASEDEKLGLVYTALIELEHDSLMIGDRPARLVPGMTVTADIQVGTRRLIEYVLNPVLRYKDEAMRER